MTFLAAFVMLISQSRGASAPCGPPDEATWLCELVDSAIGQPKLARAADAVIARPVTVALILLSAWVVHRLARRAIDLRRLHEDGFPATRLGSIARAGAADPATTRRAQRAEALGTLLRSVAGVVVWGVAGLMALGELGLDLGPLLAGAGVLGVAVGFGAPTLVRDFLAGIFMLIEDQYGVGDVVDTGEATGTVESISLRITRLRSVDGVVWHVPNGEIRRVGNKSQQWSRALLDVPVPYSTDTSGAMTLIQETADAMAADPHWKERILLPPEVWGIERFDPESMAIRTVLTTKPLEQWAVSRELRRRLKRAFDEAGIEIPVPQPTIRARQDAPVAAEPR